MGKVVIKTKEPAPKPGKGVAKTNGKGGLPTGILAERMLADAGKGLSQAQEDNLIPIITITQDLTPAARKKDPKYIEGCEPGMIWLKNEATTPFISGDEGIVGQCCHYDRDFVEWIPRKSGGGLVGRHREMPSDAEKMPTPDDPNRFKWVRKNGNEMIETRYYVFRVWMDEHRRLGYVIPFASSGHTVAKGWMTTMNNSLLQNGERAAMFSKLYRLKLKTRTNTQGTWFVFEVHDLGFLDNPEDDPEYQENQVGFEYDALREYEAGLALHNAFAKGEKEMDTRDFAETGGASEEETGDKM